MKKRSIKEIEQFEEKFFEIIWWNRNKARSREQFNSFTEEQKNNILEKLQIIEKKYKEKELILDDFDYGMINGKLSALRWVLGEEWDFLDT
jgi:hypothetical protein